MTILCRAFGHKWIDKDGIIHDMPDPVINQAGYTVTRCQRKGCSETKNNKHDIRNKVLIAEDINAQIKSLRK